MMSSDHDGVSQSFAGIFMEIVVYLQIGTHSNCIFKESSQQQETLPTASSEFLLLFPWISFYILAAL